MKVLAGMILACFLLAGCATQTQELRITPYMAQSYTPSQMCLIYYRTQSPVIMEEIQRRGMFSESQRRLIRESKVARFMSEDAVRCAWGEPDQINTTISAAGRTEQWVYHRCPTCKMQFIYFELGKVTAIQS
ncbi:hypothetical protein [Chromohalobacter israelensis]|uniref:hypothetical protein n=1 Tax=Chromohalobacter israelensis TaxID=141390 RepID=UPI00265BC5C2|nr:hypothetical protein [Chromohalobacter salexigens]MDO0944637.1 hypothetical protein [Chromohalobacter salexigens]